MRGLIVEVEIDFAHHAPPNIAFLELPKVVSLGASLVNLSKCDVHECIAVDKMAVERLAIF